ncbi:RNA polymerase sigma factor [Jiangella alkaliphila]|uniref:RNA polymerase sigma factor, sigma-70 family n=1 Tax=Jiangella alkaliphila TaxID=419479 RepID=A0A1H2L070_9ACTN|nr:sigma-70 family RNA polymerase sigma factor [Jiangella alkaliphila]SDU74359.1 RNA polymerase sigma factor, sigma-70 family [Jiangella alkaliphila]
MADLSVSELVEAASGGDQLAWDRLVDDHASLVWAVVRSHRLYGGDAEDAFQSTWLRLVENLGRLAQPERLPAWLVTTARRECLRLLRRGGAELPDLHIADRADDAAAPDPGPVEALLAREEQVAVLHAFQRLRPRCQDLLRLTVAAADPRYADVAAELDMPVGSVGPTRQRCIEHLRRLLHDGDTSDNTSDNTSDGTTSAADTARDTDDTGPARAHPRTGRR